MFLLERAKLVVEGAGAVGVAALLAGRGAAHRGGPTAVVAVRGECRRRAARRRHARHESQAGRRLVLLARLSDRPGSPARLLTLVAEKGATCSTSSTSARAFDSTFARPPSSSCWKRAATATLARSTRAVREAGYSEPTVLGRRPTVPRPRRTRARRGTAAPARRAHRPRGSPGRPPDATAPRARTGEWAPRSSRRRPSRADRPVTIETFADLVDGLMVVALGDVHLLAGRRAASIPDRGGRHGRSRRSCRGCAGGARVRLDRGGVGAAFHPGPR